jgi:crotonobetaine/carnitine-CoA ligase
MNRYFDTASDLTLWALAQGWAARQPSRVAVVSQPDPGANEIVEQWTWGDFVADTEVLRRRLAAHGVRHGSIVMMALPNSPLTLAMWLAVPANGAAIQAVDVESGSVGLRRAITATHPMMVIVANEIEQDLREAVAEVGAACEIVIPKALGVSSIKAGDDGLGDTELEPQDSTADQIAGLLPTSGTSGTPKWVMLTHHNYVMGAERLSRNSGFLSSDRHFLNSPLFHTNGQVYVCAPAFITGGSIAIVPRFSAGDFFGAARRMEVTVCSMVAPPMRMALSRAVEREESLENHPIRLIQYGMNLSTEDWSRWDRLLPHIQMRQIYGQTESVSGVIGGSPWEADDRVSIGRPFLGIEGIRVVHQDGRDVPDGEPGEVWIKGVPGRSLMLGYFRDPDATATALVDGSWLRTGDIMVRLPNGRLEFRGRKAHIIRRGGENLSTYALELDYQDCPLVRDVAVTTQQDAMLDALVVAHVIPGYDYDEEAFRQWCRAHLGRRLVPDLVRLHDDFPRTASGRVIARELG